MEETKEVVKTDKFGDVTVYVSGTPEAASCPT